MMCSNQIEKITFMKMDLPEVWKGNRGAFIISRHQIPESSTLKIWKLHYNAVPKSEYFSMFQHSNIHHCKGNAPTLHQMTKISRIGLFEHYINNVTHQAAASSTSVFLLSEFHPQFDWEKNIEFITRGDFKYTPVDTWTSCSSQVTWKAIPCLRNSAWHAWKMNRWNILFDE